ncbi:MAG: patatin-like phospholipase family protein [Betaproteobacteria bacterium]
MRANLVIAAFVASLNFCSGASAQQPRESTVTDIPAAIPQRPKIALVLSGGGARGFAHIGALKVLREMNVPVDMVIGTSMGAVVGGAFAAGYPVEKLEALMKETSWDDVFTTKAPRQDLDFRRKDEDNQTISRFSFGLTREGLVLPRATFSSNVLEEVLRRIAPPSLEVDSLDNLALPFRSVATDLYTGEFVVLEKTSLFNAMRASMSIPGAFAPLPLGETLLVDGGLARNLPIDVARKMGADIIIAVNVGTPLMPPDRLNSALDIAQQMINILTEQNVRQSLSELTPRDILISPKLSELTFIDFANGPEIVARGETAARTQMQRLRALAVPAAEFAAWETRRTASMSLPREVKITDIRVQGTERSNAEVIKRALGISPGEMVADDELASRIRKLGAGGDFERINFKLLGTGAERTLIVQPTEVAWGGNTLRFGVRMQSDFKSSNQFDLLAAHTLSWVNSYGAEWRNLMQIGSTRRFESEFYQPVSHSRDWFLSAAYGYRASDTDIFEDGRRAARLSFNETKAGVYVGRQLGLIGEIRLGRVGYQVAAQSLIPDLVTEAASVRYDATEAQLRFDTLDSASFPRKGYSLIAFGQRAHYPQGGKAPTTRHGFAGAWALSSGPYTLFTTAQYSVGENGGAVPIGGFLNLSGTPVESVLGDKTFITRTVAFRRIGMLPGALGGSLYAGASLELGGGFSGNDKVSFGGMKRAAAVLLGAETIIGPVYFGAGKTWRGGSAVYLVVGQP